MDKVHLLGCDVPAGFEASAGGGFAHPLWSLEHQREVDLAQHGPAHEVVFTPHRRRHLSLKRHARVQHV